MAVPTIAKINAYSAAEAPDWSFSIRINVFMTFHPSTVPVPPRGHRFHAGVDRRNYAELSPRTRWNRVKRTRGCCPPSAQLTKGCDSVNKLSTKDFWFASRILKHTKTVKALKTLVL
jgi:hypothetical protein